MLIVGAVLGLLLFPFIQGAVVLGRMMNFEFVGGAIFALSITAGFALFHDLYLKWRNPDYLFLIENHPRAWKIGLGIYFAVSVVFYWTLQLPFARVDQYSSISRFSACMVLAVPAVISLSGMLGDNLFTQKWVKRKADEIRPVPVTPPTPPKEWGPAAPVENPDSDNVFQFDKDKFKRD